MKRSLLKVGLVVSTLLLVVSLVGAATAEELLVYTALEDDEIPIYLDLFKKAHPDIEVNIVRDSTGIITAKLLAEKDNPQADVVWGTAATSLMLCDQAGMVEPYAKFGPCLVYGRTAPGFSGTARGSRHWLRSRI